MIALNVETFGHAFGVRERRWIDKDHVKLFVAHAEVRQAIRLNQAMLTTGQAVNAQVFLRPLQISTGHIYGGSAACAAQTRMDTGGAGVSKQVKEVFTVTHLAQHFTRDAVIEE